LIREVLQYSEREIFGRDILAAIGERQRVILDPAIDRQLVVAWLARNSDAPLKRYHNPNGALTVSPRRKTLGRQCHAFIAVSDPGCDRLLISRRNHVTVRAGDISR
jgi:hypothetical protein